MKEYASIIRTVTGDFDSVPPGIVYPHEHLILDSSLIEDRFPAIWLNDVDAAIAEAKECREAGVALMVDAMPMSAGRDAVRLAQVSERSGVLIVAATGLHHDRYYGPRHWTNRVDIEKLVELFVADLTEGIDEFDYTGPIVVRSSHRAGIIKLATSGQLLGSRDLRVLQAGAAASMLTGAPILTHCEGGWGGLAQIETLTGLGVPTSSMVLSHVDKTNDIGYLTELAQTGVLLEFDRPLRQHAAGEQLDAVDTIVSLIEAGFESKVTLSNDGANRAFWHSYGGSPGLAWLGSSLPTLLQDRGVDATAISSVMRQNALRHLQWRNSASPI